MSTLNSWFDIQIHKYAIYRVRGKLSSQPLQLWRDWALNTDWQMWVKDALLVPTPSSAGLVLAHDVRCGSCHGSWMSQPQNAIFFAPFLQTPAVLPGVQLSNTDIYRFPPTLASPRHLLFILENVVKVQSGFKQIYAVWCTMSSPDFKCESLAKQRRFKARALDSWLWKNRYRWSVTASFSYR